MKSPVRKTPKGYKINYSTNKIIMNYKFAKLAEDVGSEAYKIIKEIKDDYPTMIIVVNPGRIITTTRPNKNLTYENMKRHISVYENSTELLANFNQAKELSKPLASPYKYVCDWFNEQFPDYWNCTNSLYNAHKGIDVIALPNINNYERKELN